MRERREGGERGAAGAKNNDSPFLKPSVDTHTERRGGDGP